MVLEKVHGLQATSMSLDQRFSLLAKAAHDRVAMRRQPQRRTNSFGPVLAERLNFDNRMLVQQVARQLQMQAKRAIRQRLGFPQSGLRRFGSEGNLPRLRRSNSFGNLSQQSIGSRVSWRQSNGNLSRSASFNNLSNATWRGFRRRGGGRQLRGRFRGRGGMNVGIGRISRGQPRAGAFQRGTTRNQTARRARPGTRGRGSGPRNQQNQQKPVTKEELDRQLDQYMAGTKAALDLELDLYMKNAMDME